MLWLRVSILLSFFLLILPSFIVLLFLRGLGPMMKPRRRGSTTPLQLELTHKRSVWITSVWFSYFLLIIKSGPSCSRGKIVVMLVKLGGFNWTEEEEERGERKGTGKKVCWFVKNLIIYNFAFNFFNYKFFKF